MASITPALGNTKPNMGNPSHGQAIGCGEKKTGSHMPPWLHQESNLSRNSSLMKRICIPGIENIEP
jgi:hypothetical protein